MSKRQFDNFGSVADDPCAIVARELQNRSIGDYMLYNSYLTAECQKDKNQFDDFIANNPNLRYKDGFGFLNGCVVDSDSELRNGAKITNEKEKVQLNTRWYQAVPSFNKGGLIVNVDSRLKLAEDTSAIRSCVKTTEKDFNRFTPMTPCLAQNIQNPEHIITPFRWGGEATRQYVQEAEYLQKCGFTYNGIGWVRS